MKNMIPIIAFVLSLGGCALFGSPATSNSNEITPEQEAKLREIGGEQLVADAHFIGELGEGVEGDGIYQVKSCFYTYLLARKQEREGEISPEDQFRSCASMCESADERTDQFVDLTTRYISICRAEQSKLVGATHLVRARDYLTSFSTTEGNINLYYRAAEVRGALKQAEEALGADDERVVTLRGEFDALYEPHREALERVHAFFVRDDVKQLQGRIDGLQAEIDGLQKDAAWSEHAKALLPQRKQNLADAEHSLSALMKAANL